MFCYFFYSVSWILYWDVYFHNLRVFFTQVTGCGILWQLFVVYHFACDILYKSNNLTVFISNTGSLKINDCIFINISFLIDGCVLCLFWGLESQSFWLLWPVNLHFCLFMVIWFHFIKLVRNALKFTYLE